MDSRTTQNGMKPKRVKVNKYEAQAKESREAWKREMACESKRAFQDEASALTTGNNAYRCRYCGLWHTSAKFRKLVAYANAIENIKSQKKMNSKRKNRG